MRRCKEGRCLNTDLTSEQRRLKNCSTRHSARSRILRKTSFSAGGKHKLSRTGRIYDFAYRTTRFPSRIATRGLRPRLLRPKVTAEAGSDVKLLDAIGALSAKFMLHPVLFTQRLIINYQSRLWILCGPVTSLPLPSRLWTPFSIINPL